MMRGKLKSPEAIVRKFVRRSHYFIKKYPTQPGGKSVEIINYEGRKKSISELVKMSIPNKMISSIIRKNILSGISYNRSARQIVDYVLKRYGRKNKQTDIKYLKNIHTSLNLQSDYVNNLTAEFASNKKHLSQSENKDLHTALEHRAGTDIFVISRAINIAI